MSNHIFQHCLVFNTGKTQSYRFISFYLYLNSLLIFWDFQMKKLILNKVANNISQRFRIKRGKKKKKKISRKEIETQILNSTESKVWSYKSLAQSLFTRKQNLK